MNRSLVGFLVFCVVLVGTAGVAAWWIGPTLLSLALDETQRNAPYYLLHLAAPMPDNQDAYTNDYHVPMRQLVVDDGGQLVWQANTLQLVEGSVRNEWTQVALAEFEQAADFIQMITSSRYRQISAANPVERVVVGTSDAPDGLERHAAVVLCLFQVDEAVASGMPIRAGKLANLKQYGGTVVWETGISVIDGDAESWDNLLAVQFGSVEQAELWLRDPASITERAIARRDMRAPVMLLLRGT